MGGGLLNPGVLDTGWLFLGVARDKIRLAYLMVSTGCGALQGVGAICYRNLTFRKQVLKPILLKALTKACHGFILALLLQNRLTVGASLVPACV